MTVLTQYICDRCSVAQSSDTSLHTVNVSVRSIVAKTFEATKNADWCDTCLISCGMVFNGKLDLSPIALMTETQVMLALGQPLVPVVKP